MATLTKCLTHVLERGRSAVEFRVSGKAMMVAYTANGRPSGFDVLTRSEARARWRALEKSGYRRREARYQAMGA